MSVLLEDLTPGAWSTAGTRAALMSVAPERSFGRSSAGHADDQIAAHTGSACAQGTHAARCEV
jgi:hypothetical protein